MEKLEKVEQVVEKCNVSYEEARDALEACDYDVLDAIVYIEQARKPVEPTVPFADPTGAPAPDAVYELPTTEAEASADEARSSKVKTAWNTFCERAKSLARKGMDMNFVAERNGERVLSIPVLVLLAGMFLWGATLWLLVIGLFFGFRYRIEGMDAFTVDVNGAMDKAANAAEDIKRNFA